MELNGNHLLRCPLDVTPVSEFNVILPMFFFRPRSVEHLKMCRYDHLAKIVWSLVTEWVCRPVRAG